MYDAIEQQQKYWNEFHKHAPREFIGTANFLDAHKAAAQAVFGDTWKWNDEGPNNLTKINDAAFNAAWGNQDLSFNQQWDAYYKYFEELPLWRDAFNKAPSAPLLDEPLTPEKQKQKYWGSYNKHIRTERFIKMKNYGVPINKLRQGAHKCAIEEILKVNIEDNDDIWAIITKMDKQAVEAEATKASAEEDRDDAYKTAFNVITVLTQVQALIQKPELEDGMYINTTFIEPREPDAKPQPRDADNIDENDKNLDPKNNANTGSSIDFLSPHSINALKKLFAPTLNKGYKFTEKTKDKDGNPCAILAPLNKDNKDNKDEKPIYIYKDRLHTEISSTDGKLTAQEQQRLKMMADALMAAKETEIKNTPGLSEDAKADRRTAWISGNSAAMKFLTNYYVSKNYKIVPKPTLTSKQSKTSEQNSEETSELKHASIRPKSSGMGM